VVSVGDKPFDPSKLVYSGLKRLEDISDRVILAKG